MMDSKLLRQAAQGEPLVIAVFSYRYDAHLVPDFIENIRPFVHGYVAWDDRAATATLTSEPDRRNRLLARAREMGARWILAADPDERIEAKLARRLPDMLAMGENNLWAFTTREMFTPDSYRTDGIWGHKARITLFPLRAARQHLEKALHGGWVEAGGEFRLRDAETNFYHFRMATPERRRLRRALYAAADPARHHQSIGYDYLDDERGMVLEPIPKGRDYKPAFREDHGLWSPDPGKLGDISPDPLETRLNYVAGALGKCGQVQASRVLEDLAALNPADPDLLPAAALIAQAAGDMPRVTALATAVLDRAPDNGLALYLRGKAAAALGDHTGLQTDLARLQALVGDCLLVQDLTADLYRPTEDFALEGARWRRWVPGPATCREGTRISAAPMSVIVIGYRAPTELAVAVASLRAQDPPCEIVVVNSGGGAVESVLAKHLDHIRLISTDLNLFVGAARNIGIDASRGKLIGFLADDCQALPGWIAGRMRDHDLGAWHVSNPIVPEPGASRQAQATIATLFHARGPSTPPDRASHYGRSHTRNALSLAGYYPTGLRIAEDAEHNRQLDLLAPCVWAPDVLTAHKEPPNLWRVARDHFARGNRMAAHPPFRARPDKRTNNGQHWVTLRVAWSDPQALHRPGGFRQYEQAKTTGDKAAGCLCQIPRPLARACAAGQSGSSPSRGPDGIGHGQ